VQVEAMTERDEREREEGPESVSTRTCVGCRAIAPRGDLLRLAALGEAPYVAPDLERKLGGRGMSVHWSRVCVVLAAKKGGFARALKRSVTIDPEALADDVVRVVVQRAESLLVAAARRKKLALGTEAVREALRGTGVEVLVIAGDADGRPEELEASAARLGGRCAVLGTKTSLGRLFGRDELGVLAILDRGIGDEVVRCTVRAAAMRGVERAEAE
jgi:predicted RNA-binding protein YlxR (DUF448 family)